MGAVGWCRCLCGGDLASSPKEVVAASLHQQEGAQGALQKKPTCGCVWYKGCRGVFLIRWCQECCFMRCVCVCYWGGDSGVVDQQRRAHSGNPGTETSTVGAVFWEAEAEGLRQD